MFGYFGNLRSPIYLLCNFLLQEILQLNSHPIYLSDSILMQFKQKDIIINYYTKNLPHSNIGSSIDKIVFIDAAPTSLSISKASKIE